MKHFSYCLCKQLCDVASGPTRLVPGPNDGDLCSMSLGIVKVTDRVDRITSGFIGVSERKASRRGLFRGNSFVSLPAHRSGRKLGPTLPTIKLVMWGGVCYRCSSRSPLGMRGYL